MITEIDDNATSKTNFGSDFIYTNDGGHLVTGNVLLPGLNQDPITRKFGGTVQFSKTYGRTYRAEVATSILEYGNHYYVVGHSSEPLMPTDVFLSKFSLNGTLIWTKTYSTTYDDFAMKVIKASGFNNDLIIVGYSNAPFTAAGQTRSQVMAFKVNLNTGAVASAAHSYGIPSADERGYDIVPEIGGNGYVILGVRRQANFSTLVIPVDANLGFTSQDPLVINDFGEDYHARSIKSFGGNYYMAGYYKTNNDRNGLLMQLSQDFSVLNSRHYLQPQQRDEFTDLEIDANGNLLTVGFTRGSSGVKSGTLMRFGAGLNNVWHKKTFVDPDFDDITLYGLDISGSKIGLVGAAISTATTSNQYNLLIVESNLDGASCCMDTQPILIQRLLKPEVVGQVADDKTPLIVNTIMKDKNSGKVSRICNTSIPNRLAINSTFDNDVISVYPNPTDGLLTVELLDPEMTERIEVFTVTGEMVYQLLEVTSKEFTIDLKDRPAGLYLMKATNRSGEVQVSRIVVTNP